MEEGSPLFQRFLRVYSRDEVVFEEGEQGEEMFIIYRGKVKIAKRSNKGDEKTLALLERGEFFGEMALIDNAPRSASAIAKEDGTELIILDKPKFTYMVQQLPDFSLAIMRKLAQRLRETNVQRVNE